MKISRWNVLLAAALCAGCGDRSVILKVDLASHLDASARNVSPPPVPVVSPGGLWTGQQALVNDQHVNMLGGMGDAIDVRDVQLTMTTITSATTGSGVDTLEVFVSDEATDPRTTSPVIVQYLGFTPGAPDTVVTSLVDNTRLTALFTQKALRLTILTSLRGPGSGVDPLVCNLKIQSLDAVVVAGRKKKI
jgi:hypothetical protein